MNRKVYFTTEDARRTGDLLGVTWERFGVEPFRPGLDAPLEHGRSTAPNP